MVEPNEVTYLAKTEWTIQTEDKIFLPSRIVLVIWNKGNLDEYVVWTEVKKEDGTTYFCHGAYGLHIEDVLPSLKRKMSDMYSDFRVYSKIWISDDKRVQEHIETIHNNLNVVKAVLRNNPR